MYFFKNLPQTAFIAAVLLLFSTAVCAQKRVSVEAVGFFSHFPMQKTLKAIKETCKEFGDSVKLSLYDEQTGEGQDFMAKKGLSGHIPMVLYIDGKNKYTIEKKEYVFSGFVGRDWQAKDLASVIAFRLRETNNVQKKK